MIYQTKKLGANNKVLWYDNGVQVLVSYTTPVAAYVPYGDGSGYLRTESYYSKTTTRHINKWLEGVNTESVNQSVLDKLIEA